MLTMGEIRGFTLGHMAARHTVLCLVKELCRRCGSSHHVMSDCTKEPSCAMCCKCERVNARHVTGSLACPMVRMDYKGRKR